MNHWIVIFSDAPDMLEVRREKFTDHLAYLERNNDIFVDGAPLSPEEGEPPVGGLWLLKTESRTQVLSLIENDPMYEPTLRSYEIYATGKTLSTTVR